MSFIDQEYTETRIGAYLREIKNSPEIPISVTPNDFYKRMVSLPMRAVHWDINPPRNAFRIPRNLNVGVIPDMTGIPIRDHQIRDVFITPAQEMLLLAFEAKPRPLSFAMTGYSLVDFMAYIYQDVYCKENEISLREVENDFGTWRNAIVEWLRSDENAHISKNNAMRHIRKRFALVFDARYQSVAQWQKKPANAASMMNLFAKLLESDHDVGYTNGAVRDFRLVRQDFNLLAEHCFLLRNKNDPIQMEQFSRAICPSKVQGAFSEYRLIRKTGRKNKTNIKF